LVDAIKTLSGMFLAIFNLYSYLFIAEMRMRVCQGLKLSLAYFDKCPLQSYI